jgi:hypothetical protein
MAGSADDLDFEVIREPFDTLFIAMGNKAEREWPSHLEVARGAQPLVLLLVRVSEVTYRTVRSLCTDKSSDPFHRREYALSALPLARTLADYALYPCAPLQRSR